MAASRNEASTAEEETVIGRKKRYARTERKAEVAVTPIKLQVLRHLLDYRFLLVPQTAKLMHLSEQAARRHLRELFDAGFVERIAVPRSALADDGEANDPSLTYGSAPAIHALSKGGIQALIDAGIAGRDALKRPPVNYGPQNSLFLRHELFVRDIRIWLSTLDGYPLISWQDGPEPGPGKAPASRPDATFALRIGGNDNKPIILAGFVEADRGTERGLSRWTEKLQAYAEVFSSRERTAQACGYRHARVLVVTRTESRRDRLWEQIEEIGTQMGLGPEVLERFWIADKSVLNEVGLAGGRWCVPGTDGLWAVVGAEDRSVEEVVTI